MYNDKYSTYNEDATQLIQDAVKAIHQMAKGLPHNDRLTSLSVSFHDNGHTTARVTRKTVYHFNSEE